MQSSAESEKNQSSPSSETGGGELTKEQLLVKCKNLLLIAQKAKTAKDEAHVEIANLRAELEQVNSSLKNTTKKFSTAEEMLGALTDQKLKLAMEIDDMKKERMKTAGEVKVLYSVKQKCEAELENVKKDLQKCLKEKNELLLTLENRQKSEVQLQEDVKKLKENHDKMIHYCSEGKEEKRQLEKSLDEANSKLKQMEEENVAFLKSYSEKYNIEVNDFGSLLNHSLLSRSSEELNNLESEKVSKLQEERDSAIADHDKIVQTLDEVRVETKQLIDNSEQLDKEIKTLKAEKSKLEEELNSVKKGELESAIHKLKAQEEENKTLKANMQIYVEKLQESSKIQDSKCNEDLAKMKQEMDNLNKNFNDVIKKNGDLKSANENVISLIDKIKNYTVENITLIREHLKNNKLIDIKDSFHQTINNAFPEGLDEIGCQNFKSEFVEVFVSTFEALLIKESDSNKLQKELNNLKTSLKQTSNNENTQLDRCTRLETELGKIKEEKNKIQTQFESLDDKCNGYENELFTANEKVVKMQEELDSHKSACVKYENDIKNHIASIKDLTSSLESSHNKCTNYETKLKNVENEQEKNKQEREQFVDLIDSLQSKSKEYEVANTNNKKTIDALTSEITSLQTSRQKLDAQMKEMSKSKDELLEKIKEYKTSNEQLNNQISASEEKYNGVKQLNDELNQQLHLVQKNYEENENKFKAEKEDYLKQLNDLKAKFEDQTNTQINADQVKSDLESLNVKCQEYEKEKQEHLNSQEELISKYTVLQKNYNDLEAKLSEIESNKNTLLADYKAIEDKCKSYENDLTTKNNEIKSLKDKMSNSKSKVESAHKELSVVKKEANEIKNELVKKQEIMDKLKKENANLLQRLSENEKSLDDFKNDAGRMHNLEEDLNKLRSENSSYSQKCQSFEETNQQLTTQISTMASHLEKISREHSEAIAKKKEEQSKIKRELDESKELLNFKTLELEEVNKIWAGRLKAIKVGLRGLEKNMKDIAKMSDALRNQFIDRLKSLQTEIQESIKTVLESESANTKHELLDEMQCMNQELKERGEVISNLQESLKEETKKNSGFQAQIREMEEALESKEVHVKELEGELARAREIRDSATDVDVLSTSTISKTEESLRLKDLEESFEEKYVKLKMVAVKLKKRLLECTQQLESDKAKFSSEKAELLDKIQHLSTAAKNVQRVQESLDHALDDLEALKKEKNTLSNALKESNKSEEALKAQVNTLEASNQHLPVMKKQIDNLNAVLKETKTEMQKIDMEKKVEVMKYVEAKKQVQQLENKIQELTSSLDQAVKQGKSNNVLELEIKNFEKLCSDLSAQLNAEKSKSASLSEENAALLNTKNSLQEQIQMLENQIKSEEERVENVKKQLSSSKEKNENITSSIETLQSQIAELKRELNTCRNQNEEMTLEMSNVSAEFSRKDIDSQTKIDALRAHVQSLETSLASTRQELGTSKSEIEHLRQEFDAYRLRAQSTLAKQKADTVSQTEKEAWELVDKLKTELDALREKLDVTLSEVESLNNTISSLQSEKVRSEKKYEDVTKVLHQKITDYDTLMTEYKAFKISSDTVLHNQKSQHEAKQEIWMKEIAQLQETVTNLKFELNEKEYESKSDQNLMQASDETILQEREDAEGSESIPTTNIRRLSNIVPLDVLLNNPIDDESQVPVLQEQLIKLRYEQRTSEVRTRHLSALLREAEKDSARNYHQNAILKEEVRRLERSLERQPHIANTEYLKNVVFKFLTLQVGDEKGRLIPVLDTILKLSPEESHKLQAIAKGESGSGWGNYLPSWPTL